MGHIERTAAVNTRGHDHTDTTRPSHAGVVSATGKRADAFGGQAGDVNERNGWKPPASQGCAEVLMARNDRTTVPPPRGADGLNDVVAEGLWVFADDQCGEAALTDNCVKQGGEEPAFAMVI
jgi:hypothetical protein